MERIKPDEHASLLYRLNQLPHDKAKEMEMDLVMYLHKYLELLQDLEDTIRNYKDTAQKIKGSE